MTIPNDSASPQIKTEWQNSNFRNTHSTGGLTKREHIATQLMAGILANPTYEPPRRLRFPGMAQDAVAAADALIAELNKRDDNGQA